MSYPPLPSRAQKVKELALLKMRFALTSSFASTIDYVLYLALVYTLFSPALSNAISYSVAAVINFFMQKKFIFQLHRKTGHAFLLTLTISLGGLLISTALIYLFSKNQFLSQHQYVTKMLVTFLIFFYNFYLKRFAFERRFV